MRLEELYFHAQQAAEKVLKVGALIPGLFPKLTPSFIDNGIKAVSINIIPIHFHTKPRSLRNEHMSIGVNIL